MSDHEDKRTVRLSPPALKALAGLQGVGRNLLSPLLAVPLPEGPEDRAEMAARLQEMDGPWDCAAPALVDPTRSFAFLYADAEGVKLGQYVFSDAEGAGPAFSADVSGDGLKLSGPWSLSEIRAALLGHFALEEVTDSPLVRMDVSRRQFWCLAAYVDAYRAARLARELARSGGFPAGVGTAEVVEAWNTGVTKVDPGWSVSTLFLLEPDRSLAGFEAEIPAVLAELASVGLLEYVRAAEDQALYAPRRELEVLCREVARSRATFGLVSRHLAGPATVEASILFGWRTGEGLWVAELSPTNDGQVGILQVGSYLFIEIVTDMADGPAGAAPAGAGPAEAEPTAAAPRAATPFSRDALLSELRSTTAQTEPVAVPEAVPAQSAEPQIAPASRRVFCTGCGSPMEEGDAFCSMCGQKQ
ncbi:MAG: zinc ribbon domain-containing protein [Actinobacteria bacterium]|nr:zinc ribbon domain-containing protein [Actinomycetota bacterium]